MTATDIKLLPDSVIKRKDGTYILIYSVKLPVRVTVRIFSYK